MSTLIAVGRLVDVDDLVDAHEVAAILSLSHSESVHTYLKRYDTFPQPVIDLGQRRPRLWLRPEIVEWQATERS